MFQVVATGRKMSIWSPTPGATSISSGHQHITDWFGGIYIGFDCSGDVDFSKKIELHISMLEMKVVKIMGKTSVLMCDSVTVVAYLKKQGGCSISKRVQAAPVIAGQSCT